MTPSPAPISVIIPAYNCEAFLSDAIASIRDQTLPPLETIVVDDGSEDQTSLLATELGARVIQQANAGPAAARNTGIREARGHWIAFLDADDTWEPRKLEFQWALASSHSQIGIVTCDHATVVHESVVEPSYLAKLGSHYEQLKQRQVTACGSYFPFIEEDFFYSGWVLLPSTVMVCRTAFGVTGFFDEKLRAIEDFECFMRVMARYPLGVVESPLVRYRLHGSNLHLDSSLMAASARKYARLVLSSPDRYPVGALKAAVRYYHLSGG